ncbi:MAG: hypothetical protein ACI4Q9_02560 [Candidatus Methanomethylophilaceae archaeon]
MAHDTRKVSPPQRGRIIAKPIRGIYVDIRSETPTMSVADVMNDASLRRSMHCGRLKRDVRNIGGRPFSFIYDANFMRSKLLRFSAFDVREDILESEYILGNLFICSEDMETPLREEDFKFIVKQSVAARWGDLGPSMPIVLIGDREFESTDENAEYLSRINELLDIVRGMAADE